MHFWTALSEIQTASSCFFGPLGGGIVAHGTKPPRFGLGGVTSLGGHRSPARPSDPIRNHLDEHAVVARGLLA